MRVPIPVPTSVILCDYKLGFGLVGNYIEKFKKFQIFPLSGLTRQSGVHRTLHCALSGAPAARAPVPLSPVRCPVCTGQAL
jgi:hypothetical protein